MHFKVFFICFLRPPTGNENEDACYGSPSNVAEAITVGATDRQVQFVTSICIITKLVHIRTV